VTVVVIVVVVLVSVDLRQDDLAIWVSVWVAHPVGHSVRQGMAVVTVGVAGQRLFRPGIVVVVSCRQSGTIQTLVNVGHAVLDVDVVAV
jgi:hypothetical protein